MSDYAVNILPFHILQENISIGFTAKEKDGYHRIYKNNLPKNNPLTSVEKYAWWTTSPDEKDTTITVDVLVNKRFAKHYFNKLIFDHFFNKNVLTNRNFINDTEIYLEDISFHCTDYKKYHRFLLRIDTNDLIQGTCLLLSYDGDSFILNKSLESVQLDESLLGRIKYQNKIAKFESLTDIERADKDNIYPLLNRDIRSVLNLPFDKNYSENKYKKYYDLILNFYNSYLKDVVIGENIKIVQSGFYKPYEEKIKHTSENSNLLLFGNNQNNFIPYIGLKEYGPIQGCSSDIPIRFIFIFHEEDREYANKLFSYLKKGFKSFPGLESFVKIKFDIDTSKTIRFKNENPFEEIKLAVQRYQLDKNTIYAALYISRIDKNTEEEDQEEVYYKVKELLLHFNITSQVIFKENINNPLFNYFLPNISVALLAKLGGIPWRLYRPIKNDLVMGVGADHSFVSKGRFIGNAFCFRNDGSFKGFNAFEKTNTRLLADSIKETIEQYIIENKGFERLVIHYYKKMSWEEEEPIRNVLNHLKLSLPYIILTINESRDYVLFDNSFDGKLPQSGTFIKTKWNEYLLFNNTRYSKNTGTKLEGFPFPIKIQFKSSNYEKINDVNVVRELIDQVYQFSRMYWKSVRQRNMPVTIEYSELVAKMIAHFENKKLESFARNSLWFL